MYKKPENLINKSCFIDSVIRNDNVKSKHSKLKTTVFPIFLYGAEILKQNFGEELMFSRCEHLRFYRWQRNK